MESNYTDPLNIGSDQMLSIDHLVKPNSQSKSIFQAQRV